MSSTSPPSTPPPSPIWSMAEKLESKERRIFKDMSSSPIVNVFPLSGILSQDPIWLPPEAVRSKRRTTPRKATTSMSSESVPKAQPRENALTSIDLLNGLHPWTPAPRTESLLESFLLSGSDTPTVSMPSASISEIQSPLEPENLGRDGNESLSTIANPSPTTVLFDSW